jgi:hypothetical protein
LLFGDNNQILCKKFPYKAFEVATWAKLVNYYNYNIK